MGRIQVFSEFGGYKIMIYGDLRYRMVSIPVWRVINPPFRARYGKVMKRLWAALLFWVRFGIV